MKRCPNCNRTYTDEALSFCLHDGTPLVGVNVPPPAYNADPTVQTPGSRYANTPIATHRQDTPLVNQMRPSPTWSPMPGPQPPRRSVWPWIIGIVAILGFMGFGVLILVLALASMNANKNSNANSRLANSNTNQWNANVNSTRPAFKDDFSTEDWQTGTYAYGTAWYKDDEYHLRAKQGGYTVMYAPNKNYQTENATIRVTTRSVEGISPTGGYGLVVHSQKSKDTQAISNYAFLIRTGDTPDFQVVHQLAGKKYTVKEWSRSPYIRGGASPNQLEVVARNSLLTFYVNGHQLTSLTAMPDSVRGLAGFYTTDANDVAFDDLEIIH
jgi:hypothetical protein